MFQKRRLLIWGTTYPEFSKKYYETICTGAIDAETGKLVRLYPIRLRYREERFHLFQWIDAEIEKSSKDPRPESFRIREDNIVLGEWIDPRKTGGWAARRRWVLGRHNVFESVEALRAAQTRNGTSLGVVRPGPIEFQARQLPMKDKVEWDRKREAAIAQKDLLLDPETKIQDLTFRFVEYRAKFTCRTHECGGHDMSIRDWGLYVLDMKQEEKKQNVKAAEESVLKKLRADTDTTKRDPYLFLGNMQAHRDAFMIVGLFCPPKDDQIDMFGKP